VAVLADELISSVATTVAGQAAAAALDGGKNALATLIRVVRERLGRDKRASAALEAADQDPGDEAARADLARALKRLTSADADFAARVQELWQRAAAELSASAGGVINSMTGTVHGHVLQARDVRVEGGIHFGGAAQ
jgi:hypothetical protein